MPSSMLFTAFQQLSAFSFKSLCSKPIHKYWSVLETLLALSFRTVYAPSPDQFRAPTARTAHRWSEWQDIFFCKWCKRRAIDCDLSTSYTNGPWEILWGAGKFGHLRALGVADFHFSGTENLPMLTYSVKLWLPFSLWFLLWLELSPSQPALKAVYRKLKGIELCFKSGTVQKYKKRSQQAAVDVKRAHRKWVWNRKEIGKRKWMRKDKQKIIE